MDAAQLSTTVRRVVQVTISTRLYAALVLAVPSAFERTAVAVGLALLLAGGRASLSRAPPSATVLADLALAVATTALLQDVGVTGAGSAPLLLAHYCMVLEAGQALAPLALGPLGDTFLSNVQFLFASAVAGLLLSVQSASVALVAAAAAAAVASVAQGADELLTGGLFSAALIVVKTCVLDGLPAGLTLPTLAAVLSFVRPIHVYFGLSNPVYAMTLYQCGDALQAVLTSSLPPLTAALAGLTVLCLSPTPALRAVAQIAAMGSLVDAIIASVRPAADVDPLMTLLPVLVFAQVLAASLA
jgi:hypothetical protein